MPAGLPMMMNGMPITLCSLCSFRAGCSGVRTCECDGTAQRGQVCAHTIGNERLQDSSEYGVRIAMAANKAACSRDRLSLDQKGRRLHRVGDRYTLYLQPRSCTYTACSLQQTMCNMPCALDA